MGSDQTTRASLHGIAELLLAGPQYREHGTIRLRVLPGAIATIAAPDLRVDHLKVQTHTTGVEVRGATYAEIGAQLGVIAGAPEGLYGEGSGAKPSDRPVLDPQAAEALLEALDRGDQGLRRFAPDQTPVLWPEHFDVGITIDEVNYGVSLGDAFLDEPYMYVGPFKPRTGPFWNAPFGAARPLAATVEEIAEFFAEGRKTV
ncbi:conserved hypothetical protein [Catenulispora acidiphila DSM 44928]|uniref:Uncharacterized protein n=1 Tax=Catenulispora acidiphila (strain DSM 44928 / JCM 14897 / NBRC 102108 / NRRL B-24433 / ID139908) TaxID=479433 RepID=C7QHV8_CATAD|nr:hypothetical protein [Catenulispora acidiphila]ACU71133.1 conserved hypothetical protein [Catenulispora acidiphila DSM 44928]